MDELLEWRKEFPILDNTVYMISHSLGAMPARAKDRLQEYTDMWSTRGIRAWEEGWWMMATTVGDKIGKIIGGTFSSLATSSATLTVGNDYDLEFAVSGSSLTLYVNGVSTVTITDTSLSSVGAPGWFLLDSATPTDTT